MELEIAQLVVMGVTGAGKSTVAAELARRLSCDLADADDFHPPANIAKMTAGVPLDDADRWPWLEVIAAWIRARDVSERMAVVTCSALKRTYRDRLRAASPRVIFVHLDGTVDGIAARLRQREGHFMPPSLLASQLAALEPLGADERGVTVDALDSVAAIVDTVVRAMSSATPAAQRIGRR